MLYHENGCPNCALASQRGKYAFIYRDKLITGFVFDKIEAARITGWHDSDTQWAKVWKDGQCAIYRNEEPIIGYYTDIKAIKTKLFSLSEESSYSNVLFIVTGEDGKKGLYRMDEKEILPCVYESLKISEEVIYADGQYFDGDGSVVFECEGYDFLTKAKGGYGSSLCYAIMRPSYSYKPGAQKSGNMSVITTNKHIPLDLLSSISRKNALYL